ncbi:hypothetical protein LOD99_15930 [Oopsacas minuta]|uniref:Uncharacterized protein n=1 Tax=Oopsacas minuta TaxID=111878 RepID=A0AAV7K908_9METZ|nr:hypothetical protein LOD99_15930 [Oopsacas minuta]
MQDIFDDGDEDLHDDSRLGRPTYSKTRSNIERVQTILDQDRRITLRELEERVGISKATLHYTRLSLKMWKCRRYECLPHPLHIPDLPLSDHWLFVEMKRPFRGKRFEDFKRLEYEIQQREQRTLNNSIPLGWKGYQNDGNDV